MKLHVVSLPHTRVTRDYGACAYTQKVRRFIPMMEAQGYEVLLHQPLSREEQSLFGFNGPDDYLKINFNASEPIWQEFNKRVIADIGTLGSEGDLVCLIGGDPQQPIVDATGLKCVEFGIGYIGVCSGTFKVFESHAWRHYVYGTQRSDGQFFDEVVPNYYNIEEFPVVHRPSDYYAFVGRVIDKKGWTVARDIANDRGETLVVVGKADEGVDLSGVDYRGMCSIEDTIDIMAHAKALFVPTTYVGPFEGVHVEAQLCGTPVITTDFGIFTETVKNGRNGYRCKMYADFYDAAALAPTLDRELIAGEARVRYNTKVVGGQYADYFERLATLDGKGWYA